MLQVRLICVGKLRDRALQTLFADYEKRLQAFCRFELAEVPVCRLPDNPSRTEIEAALEREGRQILEKAAGLRAPLCIEGKQEDSPGLSALLGRAMQTPGKISFIIGSSFGLSNAVKTGGVMLSMSRMTFPHELARVMLMEQLYRGFHILQGGKYHK